MKSWLANNEAISQELSGTPNPWYFLKSIAGTNGRRTAVQIGGVLQYKLEVYCGVPFLQSLEASEAQRYKWGGVLRYKLEVYRQYFSDTLYGLAVPKRSPMSSREELPLHHS